jgi:hypothetical protein
MDINSGERGEECGLNLLAIASPHDPTVGLRCGIMTARKRAGYIKNRFYIRRISRRRTRTIKRNLRLCFAASSQGHYRYKPNGQNVFNHFYMILVKKR